MVGEIIGAVISLGCAALFYGIGVYAEKKKTPMWFWSGTAVDPYSITDIPAYNLENARMWKLYSLWYWIAGISMFISPMISFWILMSGGTIGLFFLILSYRQIEKKYIKS